MMTALICREMGWTWQEYQEQPAPFIDQLLALMNAENEAIERRQKQH